MNIINTSVILEDITKLPFNLIERVGRTCYKSEDKICEGSARPFVDKITKTYKHETLMEFADATVRVICDRGITHEIVRHRLASYAQESTRYVNYCKKGKGSMQFIDISSGFKLDLDNEEDLAMYNIWIDACRQSEYNYNTMIAMGAKPQLARNVLINSVKTEIVIKMNFRAWKHFFDLRCAPNAHPQMVEVANQIRDLLNEETNGFFL